ncbi:MAG: hypothetical protein R3E97_22355 [Candidatus Eisenbacteria bacterium]
MERAPRGEVRREYDAALDSGREFGRDPDGDRHSGRHADRDAQRARAEADAVRRERPRAERMDDPRVSEGRVGRTDVRRARPTREARGDDRRAGRPAEGGRLPERERRGPAESIALGASGLESELFLPKDRDTSDAGLRKSRWASQDPESTDADELDRPSTKRRPLDVPTYLRKRMD